MSKQQLLDELEKDIEDSQVCINLARNATQLVFGDGNPNAELLFIGEAPGKSEDEQGKPFVGAAGKFLDEMLASINLNRQDVYITNIVKYRPPNNRDPLPEEIADFMPCLLKQIELINPELIVTLGRFSMNVFLPELKISQVHGQPKRIRLARIRSGHPGVGSIQQSVTDNTLASDDIRLENGARQQQEAINEAHFPSLKSVGRSGEDAVQGAAEHRSEAYEQYTEREAQAATQQRASSDSGVTGFAGEQTVASCVILPLYHPAAALYNGGMRQTLLDDFARIPQILELIKQPQ